ncbi:DUF3919 family protein [Clostridium gasigenes]|uniref:DUF3919 family protein n=1 Tax=Clostridium gasigenes TaxID=94869 RepID=A0A7X0VQ84_9CLOT|nr:DUF3919 family protein [Clostridium gasigenes]MBB6713280.1 DUF3919 family protein [Clostridium gasigenes]MBU3104678.1 DUF3919 family protein [Clostridium gasigenes]MBU3107858.1 DUF3919 family protein [Clostridium gasigenes]MBU3133731.1 DUF3919 family protein [Clostridium gasigenes]NKF06555.1 DUF3919 family protein [Clostridium gasigenes]
MKRINSKFKIAGIYMVILLLCIVITNLNYSDLYNKVTIIQDKEEVLKKINMSIPVKIEMSNERWGDYVFEDENSIKNIWDSINEITNDSIGEENHINKNNEVQIKGTVYYLNGMKDNFEISNILILNNYTYYDSYKLPMINSLRNNLLGYLYSPYNIGKFMNSRNIVTIVNSDNQIKKIGNDDKESIKNIIDKSVKLENDEEIIALTTDKKEALAHIKIYIDEEDDNLLKVKSYNMVNIDVYDNDFFVVQYMGDENGRHIYMRGNLKDICENLGNNDSN